jgi:uncharacterized membrane protein
MRSTPLVTFVDMNQPWLHLAANHVPVICSFSALVVLLYAFFINSEATMRAAAILFVISALGASVTYVTGEPAEEAVEHLQGISEAAIEDHEEAGFRAFISMLVVGIISVVALWLSYRRHRHARRSFVVLFFAGILAFAVIAYAANLGGKIRHSEIEDPVPASEHKNH